ncbi:MAG: tetratricopeptide repeat protein [Sedimentisphaerales bacterium]|nr:tetratricopeptide repeat protein [Sedimentisphaerales bacterium]
MLRPQYLHKSILVFITVSSVMLYIAKPALAQRTNRKDGESSGSEQASQRQAEQERQQQAEQQRQQQAEHQRQQQAEQQRQRQAEQQRQRQAEQERQRQAEQERQRQAEQERQRQAEQQRQRQAEQERQRQAEQERQRQAEQAKQRQAEQQKQQQIEQARQRQTEQARQRQTEQARQRQTEQERQQQAEQARQQQAEQERQRQQSERINRKQLIISPYDRKLEPRTDEQTSERVNRKLPSQPTNTNNVIVDNSAPAVSSIHRYVRPRPSHLAYRDRPYATDTYRREHVYWDYSRRIRTRTITPGYRFTLCYNRGPRRTFKYFYPYYHRKYVFVSLGGYWPFNYRFIRYYWYGYHPYYWCGYYPIAHEVVGTSYNYYTYNYYYDDDPVSYQPTGTLESRYRNNTYHQLVGEPAGVTPADIYFEEAVRAFEEGNYGIAIENFAKAMELAPDDIIIPFAYSQALFAAQRYTEAAEVLRTALAKITTDKEGVFYPRGLYPKDEVLLEQLDMLIEKIEIYKFDADLQLLLGYQLLGLGQLDEAVTPLKNAGMDLVNAEAAAALLGILEKIKAAEIQNEDNITNYLGSFITEPETKGVETETNTIPDITSYDTQASPIEQDTSYVTKSDFEAQDIKISTPEIKAVIDANGTAACLDFTDSGVSPIAAEGKITNSTYSAIRQNVALLAVAFVLAAVACVCRYISG